MIADFSGYISWIVVWYWFYKNIFSKYPSLKNPLSKQENFDYLLSIISGAFCFWILFSTLDNYLINPNQEIVLTKSIAASIFWAVFFSELFKYIHKVQFNTGVVFIPSLVVWMIFWRIWAFMIWLRDHTHGIPTTLPWGVDYGDGITRHPLQIYEITILSIFFIFFIFLLQYKRDWLLKNGFFLFTLTYFSYRFVIWFISPYSHFWWWLNTYQVISLGMIMYSLYKIKNNLLIYGKNS